MDFLVSNEYRNVVASDRPQEFPPVIPIYVSFYICSAVCLLPNIVLMATMLSQKVYKREFLLLMLLCLGEILNCASIGLTGIIREGETRYAMRHNLVPVRHAIQCALLPSGWMRIVSNVTSSTTHVMISVDRFLSVAVPLWFKNHRRNRQAVECGMIVGFTTLMATIGFMISYDRLSLGSVNYKCGRKVSYGNAYTLIIYFILIIGYFSAFVISAYTYYILVPIRRRTSVKFGGKFTVTQLRLSLLGSFVSFLLVSIPNINAVAEILFEGISTSIGHPVDFAALVNSSINLFLYMSVSKDFRSKVYLMFKCIRYCGHQKTPKVFAAPQSIQRSTFND